MLDSPDLPIGQAVSHREFGEGVVIGAPSGGFVAVFFRQAGTKSVPIPTLSPVLTWEQRVSRSVRPADPMTLQRLWLALEAERIPLADGAATLTAAKVDLLPHQVVLIHRVAETTPRRFLIADEVGLGKTIETALILRELKSRGQLRRALMAVPAGLVNNWHRELNEVFHLDFEVFGSEGDVTDRRSNAFTKHNWLIASIDTLKQPARMRRLLEAPHWDMVVFDEAHHLSAYRDGSRAKKTENYKLAETLRNHCRDLLLLSATPHQGDHFRFWMLIRLLQPTLFEDERDMVTNRHRLNAVVVRRTKADACDAHGNPLFARRQVTTQAFQLTPPESEFYNALLDYLRDGYNLAERQGNRGRALGFVMTIFQKIASSSFAAIRLTLQRRLLMLTVQEAVEQDQDLNVRRRDAALMNARQLLLEMHGLPDTPVGWAQADRLLADLRLQVVRRMEGAGSLVRSEDLRAETEVLAANSEESVAFVRLGIPMERQRIQALLERFPQGLETKVAELIRALKDVWQANPDEKIVVFATYIGSVDALKESLDEVFPGKGVDVLRGGDHGAKLAAERRFRSPTGPKVLICTAAGREGINLQFSRVLFNYDLPWNPMDLEQRIGRIHRYGQRSTAQVYNFVASDTIEGEIYLLLEEKLLEIAQTLGKVDELGQVAEDLRSQILGQLGERLSYERLYQDAVRDPSLQRSRQELEVALDNAARARRLVFELFQDLAGFNLADYQAFDDKGSAQLRLRNFVKAAASMAGLQVNDDSSSELAITAPGGRVVLFTMDRERAVASPDLELLGLEHPLVKDLLDTHSSLPADERSLRGRHLKGPGLLTVWRVEVHGNQGQVEHRIIPIAVTPSGERSRTLEQVLELLTTIQPGWASALPDDHRQYLIGTVIPEMLRRELTYQGLLDEQAAFSAKLLTAVELVL